MTPLTRERAARWTPPILVAAAALAVFAPALAAGFVSWDDGVYVVDNPLIRGLGLESLRRMLVATRGGLWQPLTWLSFAADHAFWGLEPSGFHATNLLIHAASSVVFYAIGLRLFGGRRAPAALAALFFAVHPLRVESVAWVTERKGLLSSLFFLLAALAHLTGRARAAAAALALALTAKATALVLPAVLLILEVYPLRRLPAFPARWLEPRYRAAWRPLVPLFLLSAVSFTVAVLVGKNTGVISSRVQLGAAWHVDRILCGLLFYPWKTLWPANLSPYRPPLPWFGLDAARSLAAAGLVLGLLAAIAAAARRVPAVAAAFAAYAVTLLPVIGIVQQGMLYTACDRFSYLSCLGFALLFGAAAARGRAAVLLASVWLAGLGAASWRQCAVWRDSTALWSAVLERTPGAVARANMGAALVKGGRVAEGRQSLERALAEDPGLSLIYENLGVAARRQGREDEARSYWRRGIAAAPSPELAALLGASLAEERGRDGEAGIMLLRAAVAGDQVPAARRADLAAALARAGRMEEAEAEYGAALALEPDQGRAHNNLGLLLERRGRARDAAARFRAALRDPAVRAEANHNLGNSYLREGRLPEAERRFREAVRLDSGLAQSRVNLGNILARRGDFGAAAAQYRAALKTAPGSVEARANLGAISPYLGPKTAGPKADRPMRVP